MHYLISDQQLNSAGQLFAQNPYENFPTQNLYGQYSAQNVYGQYFGQNQYGQHLAQNVADQFPAHNSHVQYLVQPAAGQFHAQNTAGQPPVQVAPAFAGPSASQLGSGIPTRSPAKKAAYSNAGGETSSNMRKKNKQKKKVGFGMLVDVEDYQKPELVIQNCVYT